MLADGEGLGVQGLGPRTRIIVLWGSVLGSAHLWKVPAFFGKYYTGVLLRNLSQKDSETVRRLSSQVRLGFTASMLVILLTFGIWDSLYLCNKDPFSS